jgi:N-ethylmaleimide reductase
MLPVAPSAVISEGKAFIENDRGEGELVPFIRPRALNIEEMPYIVAQYERRPGTPKPPISTASRYMPPTAICSISSFETGINRRNDAYGGPVENRARLLFEVAEALMRIWGPILVPSSEACSGSTLVTRNNSLPCGGWRAENSEMMPRVPSIN